jgi:hypothetical protein
MTDTRFPDDDTSPAPAHDPSLPWTGIGRVEIPRPPHLFVDPEDEPLVMHEDLLELLADTKASYCAVAVLVNLLRGSPDHPLNAMDCSGLSELMGSVQGRIELTLDGLVMVATALGLPNAREFAHG